MQPLNGIRVLDLSRVLAGPYCTMLLGDLGADVTKVESPEGDETRGWGPPFAEGESAYFLCVNRNKRGIVVDFKTEEGREIIRRLVRQSDVLVENFRPGSLSRFSLDFESVSVINPNLIYCSITGFGQTGPLRDKPGYDFMIQAMGGIMSVTGESNGEPMKSGVAIADLFAGQNVSRDPCRKRGLTARTTSRYFTVRFAIGMARQCREQLFDLWQSAQALWQRAREHCPVSKFSSQ
jgi:formyl-CoA transferase